MISIHAPTRGATNDGVMIAAMMGISIHAPTRGATWYGLDGYTVANVFQSTLPRGERQ